MIWRCNHKYEDKSKKCTTPYLDENQIKNKFTIAVNKLLDGVESTIDACEDALSRTLDISELERNRDEILSEIDTLHDEIQLMIQQNATVPQEQNQYTTKYDETSLKLKEAESRKNIVEQKIKSMQERRSAMEQFIKNIKRQNNIITEFSEELWCSLLDYVTAYSGGKLVFRFRNGSEIVA